MPEYVPQFTPGFVKEQMVRGYLECAEWLLPEEERARNPTRWAPEAVSKATEDCYDFMIAVGEEDYHEAATKLGNEERIGHDLFLTRNRHGAGFWDRGLGALGDRLTDHAHAMGESDVYVGDDGLIYFS